MNDQHDETIIYWKQRALTAELRLARIEKLFPGGVSLGEMFEVKKAREDAEDRAAGIVEVPNQNPLPKDPFFHVG